MTRWHPCNSVCYYVEICYLNHLASFTASAYVNVGSMGSIVMIFMDRTM
jgi:hypothetical protein